MSIAWLSFEYQFFRMLLFSMSALFVTSLLLIKYRRLFVTTGDAVGKSDYGLKKKPLLSPYLAPFVFAYVSLILFATTWLEPVY